MKKIIKKSKNVGMYTIFKMFKERGEIVQFINLEWSSYPKFEVKTNMDCYHVYTRNGEVDSVILLNDLNFVTHWSFLIRTLKKIRVHVFYASNFAKTKTLIQPKGWLELFDPRVSNLVRQGFVTAK